MYVKVGLTLAAIAIISFLVYDYYKGKKDTFSTKEGMENYEMPEPGPSVGSSFDSEEYSEKNTDNEETENFAQPAQPGALESEYSDNAPVDFEHQTAEEKMKEGCYPSQSISHEDLLPKDQANSRFSQLTPAGQGEQGNKENLDSGYLIGINTSQGKSPNSNHQLRSIPPAPQYDVSVFNKPTLSPDFNRKGFEISSSC